MKRFRYDLAFHQIILALHRIFFGLHEIFIRVLWRFMKVLAFQGIASRVGVSFVGFSFSFCILAFWLAFHERGVSFHEIFLAFYESTLRISLSRSMRVLSALHV